MQRWTLLSRAERGRVILSGAWTTSICYKPREIERRTFALKKPNDRCHGMLGRDLDAHMHMIWHHMSLDDAAFLLAGQLMKDWPELTTNLPKQLLPATFGHKHNMVLAIPARMRQALIER